MDWYEGSEYISAILESNPLTRQDTKQCLQEILGKHLINIIDQHNTPALLAVYSTTEGPRILKVEVGRSPQKTIGEIHWYRSLDNMGKQSLSPRFLGGLYNNNGAGYELEYLSDYTLLEDLVMSNALNEKQIEIYILDTLNLLFDLFSSIKPRLVSFQEAEIPYWLKIKYRMKEVNKIPWLRTLLQQQRVVINDEEMLGIPFILKWLSQENVRRSFTPRQWGFIHGDMHFGNMLIKKSIIKLIDPNGNTELPLEYDIGKILHSAHGRYNRIHRGKFYLRYISSAHKYRFEIGPAQEAGHRFINFLSGHLPDSMLLRSMFSECCHFLTMLPHHAQDQKETTALYLQTLKLFQNLFEKVKD